MHLLALRRKRRLPLLNSCAGVARPKSSSNCAPWSRDDRPVRSSLRRIDPKGRLLTERLAAEDTPISQAGEPVAVAGAPAGCSQRRAARGRPQPPRPWLAIDCKAARLEKMSPIDDVAAFVAELGPRGTSRQVLRNECTSCSDELADRLRREADRVARKAEWLAQLNRHRTAQATLTDQVRLIDEAPGGALEPKNGIAALRPPGYHGRNRNTGGAPRLAPPARGCSRAAGKNGRSSSGSRAAGASITVAPDRVDRSTSTMRQGATLSSARAQAIADVLAQAEAVEIKRHDDLSQRRAKLEPRHLRQPSSPSRAEQRMPSSRLEAAEAELDHLANRVVHDDGTHRPGNPSHS